MAVGDAMYSWTMWCRTQALGVVALCALLCANLTACSQATGSKVAQDIVNFAPALTSAVNTINATVSSLSPQAAPIFAVATAAFDAGATLVVSDAKAYLANPSASVLVNLQTAVTTLQQNANAALLQTAGIKDAQSLQLALAAINGLATVVSAILGLVQTVSTKAQLRVMAAQSPIKLATVRRLMDQQRMEAMARTYQSDGVSVDGYFAAEAAAGF